MALWNLNIKSRDTPYSFWSFSRHGQGRNSYNILEATLGVYQTHPLNFKSNNTELIICGADNPSKKIIKWNNMNVDKNKNVNATIITLKNSNKTVIDIVYDDIKHCFELKNMAENKKLYSISETDLDLIIRNKFKINMMFDVLRLICEYNKCIYDINNNINILKYHNIRLNEANNNIINTSKLISKLEVDSYVSLEMSNEVINGKYDKFIVECECKPDFKMSLNIAGIISLHGAGTGWELRVSNKRACIFEWLFTTYWNNNKWMHNELSIDYKNRDNDDWIYLKGEYDGINGLQTFTVNNKTISRKIKGKPKIESRRGVEFGRGFASRDRRYYGLIRNIKIDGWNL